MTAEAFPWPEGRRAAAALTVDLDAESGMLFEHPRSISYLNVMAHQAYEPRTGLPRMLEIFKRHRVTATFFTPGYTAERWPDAVKQVRDAGHEIGHHGYLHEPLHDLDEATEERYLLRGLEALDTVLGVRPIGFRAPKFRTSYRTPLLLAKHGFRYEAGLMDSDHPYRLAVSPNDLQRTLVELPVQWALDDWAHYAFLPGFVPGSVIQSPDRVLEIWTAELEAMVEVGGCFIVTLHPFLSGRPSRARVVENLIERLEATPGVWIAPCREIAQHVESLGLEPVIHRPPHPPGEAGED